MPNETEQKVGELISILEAKGHRIPRSVGDIPSFPYSTFDSLSRAFAANEVLLQRFTYELSSGIFKVLATPAERFWSGAYAASFALIPIASVALGFFVSWLFLLLIPLVVISMSRAKTLYNRVIFRGAFESEPVFCFLYYIRQVSVTTADYQKSYWWNDPSQHKS